MKKLLFLSICCFVLRIADAQPTVNLWEDVSFSTIALPRGAEVFVPARTYRTLQLDFERAATLLQRAPKEGTSSPRLPFRLPLPDGSIATFHVWESAVMESGLAARYPHIKSFLAQGVERPELSARLDISPIGFHAAVMSPEGLFYIDPLSQGVTTYYAAYFTKDIQLPDGIPLPHCGVSDTPIQVHPVEQQRPTNFISTLRDEANQTVNLQTYRLALACTGEYAQAKGGNKTAVLASMVAALNRVNQIFEKETAVRLLLIQNNDTLIYLDSATDPYSTPDNASTLVGQNTTVLNQVIGATAYDLGHVFTLGCKNGIGGIASYASTCGPNKGAGVTCHFTSNTDFIAVQIMAHELGHQFACGHSWNSCPEYSSQLDLDDAFEPGSGSTIMSYANACGPDNIQSRSDDYYHVGSLEDFYAFSRQYQGKTCATVVPTENRLPVLTLDYPASFYVPVHTPFELRAKGVDADGDPLTYCWEQYDLGPSVPLGTAQLSAPLFRSFRPDSTPVRTFPRLSLLVKNEEDNSELLPSYARKMTFRCTVRDNHPGAAGVVWKQVQFQVSDQAGPFLVLSPNSTELTWESGSTQTVRWDVARTDQAPVQCRYVHIRLSIDGGLTYPYLLAEHAMNTGNAVVTIPEISTDAARIRVEAADNIFFDLSDQNFKITAATTPGYSLSVQPYTIPLHCQPAPLEYTIQTGSTLGFQSSILLELTTPLPFGTSYAFRPNPVRAGESSQLIIMPNSILQDTLELGIRASVPNGPIQERTVRVYTLSNQFDSLHLVSPADGTTGIVLSTPLSWSGTPNASSYNIELSPSPAFGATRIFSSTQVSGTSVQPNVLLENNRLYYWRIQPNNACGAGTFLDPFTFHTATTSCKTYESTNVPLNISGAGTPTIESRITVPVSGILSDINIPLLRINKEYVRNLRVSLISPKGTEVVLYNGHCALTSKLFLGFDDDAPQAVNGTGVCPPDDGIVFRPTDSLGRFKGEQIQGVWTLRVRILKNESLSPGALESWKLEFCSTFQPEHPRLTRNTPLAVPPAKSNAITPSHLQAEDATALPDQLQFTVVRPPANGLLKLQDNVLVAGSHFTQAAINAFQLQYTHGGGAIDRTDYFTFVVENGQGGFLSPRRFSITLDTNAVVGIHEPDHSDSFFRVFPNPANTELQIAWDTPLSHDGLLRLFDLYGQTVYQQAVSAGQSQYQIPVSDLPAGVYLIQVHTATRRYQQKATVQH